ncbi:uncharacterized protein LOC142237745 [Haematobia irritans]|uniref:uncharacterized protein LOC142237745 n=1 Tax=Haematobia irritans TaxID=7368 RepID=UPI003F4FBC4A
MNEDTNVTPLEGNPETETMAKKGPSLQMPLEIADQENIAYPEDLAQKAGDAVTLPEMQSKSDKAVSTTGMPDLDDYRRAVTYELVFNSLLEKKMQAMKRDCEERKRNKRLKRKSIGRIFLAKRLFSSVDSRKSSVLSDPMASQEVLQAHSEPTTPQKCVKRSSSKTAITKKDSAAKHQESTSIHEKSPSLNSSRLGSPLSGAKSKSKSNTASSESQSQSQPHPPPSQQQSLAHIQSGGADDSITSTLSNSSGKIVKRHVLVMAQTHGTPSDVCHTSSSSPDSKAFNNGLRADDATIRDAVVKSRDPTCDTTSLASGYGNGSGARLNSNTLGDDSLTSLRDSIESLSFASSRCTVSFGAAEIIPDAIIYDRRKAAAKRQRILDAKSISAQCSPILPSRHVIKTMVHAPMSPPVTKVLSMATNSSASGQPPINIIEPLPSTVIDMPEPMGQARQQTQQKRRFLPNQLSYTDSLFESRNISRQNTSEDSANLTVSTLLNQSDSLSLAGMTSSPTGGFRTAELILPTGKPVSINDRFKSKSTGILVALGNGRTRPPPPPPPCETAQPSPVALSSPRELPTHNLPIAELQQLHLASNNKHKMLIDSFKLATKSPIPSAIRPIKSQESTTPAIVSTPQGATKSSMQSLHIVTMATSSELPQQYPVIETAASSTLAGGDGVVGVPSSSAFPINRSLYAGERPLEVSTLNGAIVTTTAMPDDTAKLHRMTSTSTGSSIGPTGCCTTTKSSSRPKDKQHFKPHIIPSGQSGSDDEYRRKKRKYKRYHRCSDPVLVYPASSGLQHCILSMPPNDPIQYPYTEDYAYDMQLQMESDKNDDLEKIIPSDSTKRKHHKHRHHRHKKRHRHKKPKILVQDLETQEVKVIDPDDLPQRARWTIIATACLLLLMCLMLVGITLRMAPIIDDMARAFTLYYRKSSKVLYTENSGSKT